MYLLEYGKLRAFVAEVAYFVVAWLDLDEKLDVLAGHVKRVSRGGGDVGGFGLFLLRTRGRRERAVHAMREVARLDGPVGSRQPDFRMGIGQYISVLPHLFGLCYYFPCPRGRDSLSSCRMSRLRVACLG